MLSEENPVLKSFILYNPHISVVFWKRQSNSSGEQVNGCQKTRAREGFIQKDIIREIFGVVDTWIYICVKSHRAMTPLPKSQIYTVFNNYQKTPDKLKGL
jgi:hypothetical protein